MADYILNLLPVTEEEKAQFQAIAPDAVHVYAGRRTLTPEQLAQATVILGWPRPATLKQAVKLKWLQSMWAGVDEYTAPGILPEGVTFTSSAGSNSQSVAEHMLACLLALCRKLPQCLDNQRAGNWEEVGTMRTICGTTVLVVGTGNIGAWFARLCKGLGAHTVGLKRDVTQPVDGIDELYPMDQLDELLPRADVVALVLPHAPETVGLMSAERLAMLKEGAILLNMGRGSVLDQNALACTLQAGHLWGAALDVTEPEPLPAGHPLWKAPNLLLTPHVAGGMRLEITRKNCINLALNNLERWLAGQPLVNQVHLEHES